MTDTLTPATIGVTRLAGNIGAEITGVDVGKPLTDDTVADIRQALLRHKVIFMRGQHLDYPRQTAFARRLGRLTRGHPTLVSPSRQPLLEEIDSQKGVRANYWHTDVTYVDQPVAFTLLHGVLIPPVGGDTLWANTVTAYQSLPVELRDLADRPDQDVAGVRDAARADRPLALACRRPGHLGQPCHPALRDPRLRGRAPPRRADHGRRAGAGRRGWPA